MQLDDDTAYRAFFVSMNTPNTPPPDREPDQTTGRNAKAESADIEVNSEFIIVDKITCGLLDGNELTTTWRHENSVYCDAPTGTAEDPSEHWAKRRRIQRHPSKEETGRRRRCARGGTRGIS